MMHFLQQDKEVEEHFLVRKVSQSSLHIYIHYALFIT